MLHRLVKPNFSKNLQFIIKQQASFLTSSQTRHKTSQPKKIKTVTLIPGEGVGPELCSSVVDLFKAAGVPIEWETFNIEDESQYFSKELHDSIKKNGAILCGPFTTKKIDSQTTSLTKLLGEKYELFAHVTPIKSPPLSEENQKLISKNDIDMIVVRENLQAEYSGLEHEVQPGVVESIKVVTEEQSMKVAKYAFELASKVWGRKVICVHKANIMKLTDGLFLKCCRQVATEYPDIVFEELIVDNCAMQLTYYTEKFQNAVICTPNLYGSIMTAIGGGLVGGRSLLGGYTVGAEGNRVRIFEQGARYVGLDIAGKGIANPIGMIRSGYYLLAHLGMQDHNLQIRKALKKTLQNAKLEELPYDLGGKATTNQFVQSVISNLEEPVPFTI